MNHRLLNAKPPRIWALILDENDEVVASLSSFAREMGLDASQITAIGAFSHSVVGFYDLQRRDYLRIVIDQQAELLSLLGDIASDGDTPKLHAHVVLGLADGGTRGGHLLEARVRPTCEILITESPGHLRRVYDPATGLALLNRQPASLTG